MKAALHNVEALEADRQKEQLLLDEKASRSRRNEMGQFATPPGLAEDIVTAIASFHRQDSIRFLDPALGTGAFYAAILRKFAQQQIKSANGIELDSVHAEVAHRLWGGTGLTVVQGDFLASSPPDELDLKPNLILTNPPYVRHHHLRLPQKGFLQKSAVTTSGGAVSGLSGLYTYFIFNAHKWLARDGVAGWLVPSEFMDVKYGEALRRYLSRQVSLLRIHRFDPSDVQFADALVSSAVIIFRQCLPSSEAKVELSQGGSVSNPKVRINIPLSFLQASDKWSRFYNGDDATSHRQHAFPIQGTPLSLLFNISRGIATGANDFFILPRFELAERGIHQQFVKPILPPSRFLENEVIESDESGFPLIKTPLAVIDTELSIGQIKKTCIGLWQYLQEGVRKEIPKSYLLARRSPWYRQEQRSPAPFVCTYMSRKRANGRIFHFFWNRSKATAANTYLLLYPREPLRALMAQNPDTAQRVLRMLNSLEPSLMTDQGRVYGGGLFKIEPRELGRVDATKIADELGLTVGNQSRLLLE